MSVSKIRFTGVRGAARSSGASQTHSNSASGISRYTRALLLRPARVGSYFRFSLGILQRPELGSNPARNRGRFAGILETRKVRPVAPCEWTTQPLACREGRVMHCVD